MRYKCRGCETVIKDVVPFCPSCGRPTPNATPEQVRDFELSQWRRHQDGEATPVAATAVLREGPVRGDVVHRKPPTAKRKRERKPLDLSIKLAGRRPPVEQGPVDPDNPFHYTACTSCETTDWLLRGGRNEDGSWRYWCVRCSRPLKTDALIAHGRMPFITGGGILAALAIVATLL